LYDPRYRYQQQDLQVHHAKPLAVNQDIGLDDDNLLTLCSTHHAMADKHKIPIIEILKIIKEQEDNVDRK
jgi:predicted restriction endonuclease